MKFSELPTFLGEIVTVEVEGIDGDGPSVHLQGELLAIKDGVGLVLGVNGEPTIIIMSTVIDIKKGIPVRKLVRRKIKYVPTERIRQHLLDRHAVPWDIARIMTPATAHRMHDQVDHSLLGHRHAPVGDEE